MASVWCYCWLNRNDGCPLLSGGIHWYYQWLWLKLAIEQLAVCAHHTQFTSTGDRGMTPLNQQYGVTSSPHLSAKNESDRKRNPTNSSYTGFSLHIGGMWKRWCPNSSISLSKGHRAGISWHNHRATCGSRTAMRSSHCRTGWTRRSPKLKYWHWFLWKILVV